MICAVTESGEPPILALTGTASNSVLMDIERELDFDRTDEGSIVSVESFNRPNLNFLPVITLPAEKRDTLIESFESIAEVLDADAQTIATDNDKGGLVFCRYV